MNFSKMEVPQDYNATDSFYQSKLLQSINTGNNNDLMVKHNSDNDLSEENDENAMLDEEVLVNFSPYDQQLANNSKHIKEEDIEESLVSCLVQAINYHTFIKFIWNHPN